ESIFISSRVRGQDISGGVKSPGPDQTHPCHQTHHSAEPAAAADPLVSLRRYLALYHIATIPDIAKYRRIQGTKIGRCILAGCTEPKCWEDDLGLGYLCNMHFEYIKGKLDEAR